MARVFWFLTPLLGVAAIIISRYLADLDLLSIASYQGALSDFYFVAISICAMALVETVELAMASEPADRNKKRGASIAVQVMLNLAFFLFILVIYAKTVRQELHPEIHVTTAQLGFAVLYLTVAMVLGFNLRSQLEDARG
jgi:hypothetical protein